MDCNCGLNPFRIEFCPVHAQNSSTTMGHAALNPPNGYTYTPPHEQYHFSPFPFQETVPAPFFYGHDPSPDIQTIPPHLGYPFEAAPTAAMPDTGPFTYIGALPTAGWADPPHQLSQFATSSITTLLDSDRLTAVNAVETYGDIINQDTTIGSISNPSNTPVVIEQRRWYSEYSVDRDPNGLFHCPFAGCGKVNKRRDQLWEHWKAKHNDDPYRCGFCNKSWIYNGEKGHSCTTEMATCQICQKQITRHHLTDHQKTQGCKNKRRNNGISETVIDYGGSL